MKLNKLKIDKYIMLIISLTCMLSMFIYSGFNKIFNFNKKVFCLHKKMNLPIILLDFAMILVIFLEVFGSIYLLYSSFYFKNKTDNDKTDNNNDQITLDITNYVLYCFLAFLVVVTVIYHPPFKKWIPFLSNLCTFGGFMLILYLFNSEN